MRALLLPVGPRRGIHTEGLPRPGTCRRPKLTRPSHARRGPTPGPTTLGPSGARTVGVVRGPTGRVSSARLESRDRQAETAALQVAAWVGAVGLLVERPLCLLAPFVEAQQGSETQKTFANPLPLTAPQPERPKPPQPRCPTLRERAVSLLPRAPESWLTSRLKTTSSSRGWRRY